MLLDLPPPPVRTPDIREREFRSFVCVCVRYEPLILERENLEASCVFV